MIDRACERNLFARAARAPVGVPSDLAEQVVQALRQRCLDLIGLARRSGLVTAGYEKVRSKLVAGRAAALVQAVDAAPGGRRKMSALAETVMPGLPVVETFTTGELGRVLGRDAAVHVVLAPGTLAERFVSEAARLNAAAGSENTDTRT
jgi:ribosomal protein L7Ae-like RNA K-turn-binding protein